jgi:TRAP-type C4-dicarboxylate transport system substrate-binding protein
MRPLGAPARVRDATQIKEHTFKVGIGLSEDHPQAQALRHFAELLQAKSGGMVNAKVFASSALGNVCLVALDLTLMQGRVGT